MKAHELERAVMYEIVVRGRIGEPLATDLGARRLEARNGRTLIVVEIIDQSHLHGVLERLRDLNIEIESVNPAPAEESGGPAVTGAVAAREERDREGE